MSSSVDAAVATATPSFLPFDPQSSVWADITPVAQDDGPSPLCAINYSPEYSQAMDLLRALLPVDELSPRTLALTEHLSKQCPSNYTVWYFRNRILTKAPDWNEVAGLGKKHDRLVKELSWLDDLAKMHMKTYQVWQHRKLIVTELGDPSRELAFTASVLQEDSKNYHTWVYRQWVLSHFGGLPFAQANAVSKSPGAAQHPALWEGELAYVSHLLQLDVRNNSAWNHRYFCLFSSRWVAAMEQKSTAAEEARRLCKDAWKVGGTSEECIANEIAYTKDHIKLVPNNASAWNYLRGICKLQNGASTDRNPFAVASDLARSLTSSAEDDTKNTSTTTAPPPLALEWLLDDAEARLRFGGKSVTVQVVSEAEALVARLCEVDSIRTRFWLYRQNIIRSAARTL